MTEQSNLIFNLKVNQHLGKVVGLILTAKNTALSFAKELAKAGEKILVIDFASQENQVGAVDYFSGQADLETVLTHQDQVAYMPKGTAINTLGVFLKSAAVQEKIRQISEGFDFVVVVTREQVQEVTELADFTILSSVYKRTKFQDLYNISSYLKEAETPFLGVFSSR